MLNADFAATTRASASLVPRAQPNRIPLVVPSTTNQAFRTIGSQVATNQSRSVAMPTGRMLDAGIAVLVSTQLSIVLPRRSAPLPTSPPSPTFGTRIARMAASGATRMAFTRSAASVERDLSRRAQGKRRQRRMHAHGPRMVRRRCLPFGIRRASQGILVVGLMGFMRNAGFAVKAISRRSIAPGGWTQPLSLFDGLVIAVSIAVQGRDASVQFYGCHKCSLFCAHCRVKEAPYCSLTFVSFQRPPCLNRAQGCGDPSP